MKYPSIICRGTILHFLEDPRHYENSHQAYQYFQDGLLIVQNGLIETVEPYTEESLASKLQTDSYEYYDYSGYIITPGFVDTHLHYPQLEVIASRGATLLEWLNKYTFPAEGKFKNYEYAKNCAEFVLKRLIDNGTTTGVMFSTVHKESVIALFETVLSKNFRVISGKTLMDRNCPDYLQDTPESGYQESKELIQQWHGKGRCQYAITPRFAPTSSPEQLKYVNKLADEFPEVHIHTHLSENIDEIKWVRDLFPKHKNYLDIYDSFGLVRPNAIFAHCIYLSNEEISVISEKSATVAHCPTSNLFLGSGMMKRAEMEDKNVKMGLGSDVGGGTSYCIFKTMEETYKVAQTSGEPISVESLYYLATLGGARAIGLENRIGNFEKGKEADFIVLNPNATELLENRIDHSEDFMEKLFAFVVLGDERAIKNTALMGTFHKKP